MTTDATTDNFDMTPSQMLKTLERIHKRSEDIWEDWMALGRAIKEKQELAYRKAGNKRAGKVYVLQLHKAMGQFHPKYHKLAKDGVISALESCVENHAAVEAFRTKDIVGERLTSPRRVWVAYQEHLAEKLKSSIDDRVIKSPSPEDEGEDPFVKKPTSAGKGSSRSNRTDMMHEFRVIADKIAPDVADMLDSREATVDPQKFAERTYAKLLVQGFDPADAAKLGDMLIAYGRMLIALGEDIKRGRSLPRTLDLGAADYAEAAP